MPSGSFVVRAIGVSGVRCKSMATGLVSNKKMKVSRETFVSPGAGPTTKTPTHMSSANASPPTFGEGLVGMSSEGVEKPSCSGVAKLIAK